MALFNKNETTSKLDEKRNNIYTLLSSKSTDELLQIMSSSSGYTEIAIQAAYDILEERGVEIDYDTYTFYSTETNSKKIHSMSNNNTKIKNSIWNKIKEHFTFHNQEDSLTQSEESYSMHYDFSIQSTANIQSQISKQHIMDYEIKYVKISSAGDEQVCAMCSQFDGKIFPASNAPKLPLCPNCCCAYLYYSEIDLPQNAKIYDPSDFVLPSECTLLFFNNQRKLYSEKNIYNQIMICEAELKHLQEFMKPYNNAGFPSPPELACRDILPELYMRLGNWKNAEDTISKCIKYGAYEKNSATEALRYYHLFKEVATETLLYIKRNPGCLQRNIYNALNYIDEKRDSLKHFLRYSKQIKKVKHGNTNKLYCCIDEAR